MSHDPATQRAESFEARIKEAAETIAAALTAGFKLLAEAAEKQAATSKASPIDSSVLEEFKNRLLPQAPPDYSAFTQTKPPQPLPDAV